MSFLAFVLKNLLRRKTRTLLTILGVAVAMCTIVTLRGIAHGFERSFLENFEQRDVDLVVTQRGVPNQLSSNLDERMGEQIAAIPGVKQVVCGLVEMIDVETGEGTQSALVNGWRIGAAQYADLTMVAGRVFREGDRREVLLGSGLAENLRKKVGDAVEMQRQRFEVVGIYQSPTPPENYGAVLPLEELQQLMARKGSVTGFSVTLEPTADKKALTEQVRAAIQSLTDDEGNPYRVSVMTTREYVSNFNLLRLANGMAWVTSAVALVIGAVSMLNTMIMSVLERTKEIGILRAIGWRKRRVVLMVLGEALVLSLTASVIGAAAAFAILRWLAALPLTSGFISGQLALAALLEGLLMTIAIALLGGSYPAYRASRWLPSEALRHE
jgi:putative ABC transport system permease protein